jgi:hypothetical protein
VAAKFDGLAEHHVDPGRRARIRAAVSELDELGVEDLTGLLVAVPSSNRSEAG